VKISGDTRCCGIIGDPVAHTLSPAMHNAAFEALGLDMVYLPFRVKTGGLAAAIKGMRALEIRGLNVTMPHKVGVIRYLDEVSAPAREIGAVNTIVNDGGVLKGYNTDATGFLRALTEHGVQPERKRAVVLGAGGVSRAISIALAGHGANLVILNRRSGLGRARALAGRIHRVFGSDVSALEMTEDNLEVALTRADILVNATSIGMSPGTGETPVAPDVIRPSLVVFDAVYQPARTRLLAGAEQAGAKVIGGREMLLWQGVLAFEMWTGQPAPVEVMRAALDGETP
jgi:shikimate dehydrogenase